MAVGLLFTRNLVTPESVSAYANLSDALIIARPIGFVGESDNRLVSPVAEKFQIPELVLTIVKDRLSKCFETRLE